MFSPDGTLISASAAPHCGVLLDEELLSPDTTSLDNINRSVVKINDDMQSRGLSRGLFRDNTRQIRKRKRKKQNSVNGLQQNVKMKERPFLEQRISMCAEKKCTHCLNSSTS